jgi:hypothetical protein
METEAKSFEKIFKRGFCSRLFYQSTNLLGVLLILFYCTNEATLYLV